MSGTGTIWILGGIATVGFLLAVWAMATTRRAIRVRERLVEAIRDLGAGQMDLRLDEEEVGSGPASAFNQAARDLDLQLDTSRRSVQRLRELGQVAVDRVLLALNSEGEVEEVLGDLEGLTGHDPALLAGRHAAFFFPSESAWDNLCSQAAGDDPAPPAQVVVRRNDGVLMHGLAQVEHLPGGRFHLSLLAGNIPGEEAAAPVWTPPVASPAATPPAAVDEEGARFAAFAGGLPDGVAMVDRGVVVSASPRFVQMVGSAGEEILGRPLVDLVLPSDAVSAAALLERDRRQDQGEVELSFRRAHGQAVVLAVTVGSMEVDGRSLQLLATRDVSLRRGRHRRLENSAAWLSAALQASPDGLAVLSPSGQRPAVANDQFLRLLGLSTERIPSRADMSRVLQERFVDGAGAQAFLAGDLAADTASVTATFATRGEPGEELELTRLPVRDGHDRPQGVLLVLRDVSSQRQSREKLLERVDAMESSSSTIQDECRQLESERRDLEAESARLLEEANSLRERDEMKNNMLGNFTHEMQNPMVSIRGYNEMMLRGDLGEITREQREGLEIALRNAKRLAGLVDQLMMFARTEEMLTELTLETFPVWKLLEENISLLGDRVKAKNLQVTTRYATQQLLAVLADRNLISQVFSNVLGNAVKYSRQDGAVAVTVRQGAADELIVDVQDTGVGIPRDEQDRIFQRGFRASTAGETRGSGIGLALVFEILKRHGCQIRVDSRPGEGSTFSFTLPLAPDDGPDDDAPLPDDPAQGMGS